MVKEKVEARDSKLRELFGAVIKMVKPRYEKVDPTPLAPPVGFIRHPSLAEQIRDMVRSERLAHDLDAQGVESFEESDDFEIPDDPRDPATPYEENFDIPVSELRRRQQEDLETLKAGGDPAAEVPPDSSPRQEKSKSREDAAAAPTAVRGSDGAEVVQ